MDSRSGEEALATQTHPIIRKHPETGREGLFGCAGYIIGIEDMDDAEALPLLYELVQWQGSEPFRYSHQWEANTLVMWDNRRSEEHTSELQSLMRISYAVFCFKKKKTQLHKKTNQYNELLKKYQQVQKNKSKHIIHTSTQNININTKNMNTEFEPNRQMQ